MTLSPNTNQHNTHVEHRNRTIHSSQGHKLANGYAMEDPRSSRCHDKLFSGSLKSLALREDSNTSDSEVTDTAKGSGTGLVGLQNIANTCYMNSALQALSNLPPMTHYFINCSDLVEYIAEQSARRCKPGGLAKSYRRLMQDIWQDVDDPKEFIAPRGILYGIRTVHPMFRGYQQHDTQEFLRCFMDQLHEELTEQVSMLPQTQNQPQYPTLQQQQPSETDDENDDEAAPASLSPASESEYDTCESSMSERSAEVLLKTEYFVTPCRTNGSNSGLPEGHSVQLQQPSLQHQQKNASSAEQKPIEAARSIISDVFDGKLLSSVQCLTCDRVSTREETFQDLSLPIPNRDFLNVLHQTHSLSVQSLNAAETSARTNEGWLSWMWNMLRSWIYGPSVTLYDCMASFFSADELKGDNMYSCERCNKLRTGIKYSRVLTLPEVLCIHLKRFRNDLSYSSKISSDVYFPLEGFDMRPYIHKDCKSEVAIYNLSSVICHHGTVGGGHYTCFARNALNGKWYEFDDQFVTEVSSEVVQSCQAYVLFYHKHNPQMKLVRDEAMTLSTSHPLCDSDIQFYITSEWLSRLATFSEPGPINNQEMLCPHGGILHSKADVISQIAVPISQPLWDYLYRTFGGGPAVNIIFECEICKRAAETLSRRQQYELNEFTKYNGLQNEFDSTAIYAIAMPWLRSWQQFSRGKTHKDPGPITNEGIAAPTENGSQNGSATVSCVRLGSDYAQLNARLWRFLHNIYGGGPEIILRQALSDEDDAEEIEIIDQDDECDDDEDQDLEGEEVDEEIATASYQHNHSDTESNLGIRTTPSPSLSTSPSPSPSLTGTRQPTEAESDLRPNSPKSKGSRSKMKVSALRLNMRNKGRRNRSAYNQYAEMFGAKGNYNSHSNSEPVVSEKNEKDTDNDRTVAFPSEYSLPISIPFQSDNFQVNGVHEKSRDKGKLRNSSKSGSTAATKENVTLQKFVTLREANGPSDETDI
ncbi:ubiquitin carboxyl-terminal hydrolase 20 [Drosophila mauritiana]|uniref:Ubiquitin carboxyl-terminal hydrolase n=1 Tax=Drosophila mauritiana TaxID=7226 RepID=A0A6P8JJH9_DROMA|nr:ubiquitin carboxyl-terminal hydrolase 20 [Drosophila mauritiana]